MFFLAGQCTSSSLRRTYTGWRSEQCSARASVFTEGCQTPTKRIRNLKAEQHVQPVDARESNLRIFCFIVTFCETHFKNTPSGFTLRKSHSNWVGGDKVRATGEGRRLLRSTHPRARADLESAPWPLFPVVVRKIGTLGGEIIIRLEYFRMWYNAHCRGGSWPPGSDSVAHGRGTHHSEVPERLPTRSFWMSKRGSWGALSSVL